MGYGHTLIDYGTVQNRPIPNYRICDAVQAIESMLRNGEIQYDQYNKVVDEIFALHGVLMRMQGKHFCDCAHTVLTQHGLLNLAKLHNYKRAIFGK